MEVMGELYFYYLLDYLGDKFLVFRRRVSLVVWEEIEEKLGYRYMVEGFKYILILFLIYGDLYIILQISNYFFKKEFC